MIYQILFVFSLLIIVSNNAGYFPETLTKEKAGEFDKKIDEKIGWNLTQPGCTVGLQTGIYAAYKKSGKDWNLIGEFVIQKSQNKMKKFSDAKWKNGNVINLSEDKDFNPEDTHVIYGDAANIENDGTVSADKFNIGDPGVKLMRSEEKYLEEGLDDKEHKEGLDDEEHKETSGWSFNKEMIIFGLIPAAVVLALCSVFACCYVQKKQQKRMIEKRVVFPVHSRA